MAELQLIPSTVVGSHGKPGWWFATVKAYEAGEYGPGDLEDHRSHQPDPKGQTGRMSMSRPRVPGTVLDLWLLLF